MVFKARKIPKHLIIREEYELRKRPRLGFLRMLVLSVTVIGLTFVISVGVTQI